MNWQRFRPARGLRSPKTPATGVSVAVIRKSKGQVSLFVAVGAALCRELGWVVGTSVALLRGMGGPERGLAKLVRDPEGYRLRRREVKGKGLGYLELEIGGVQLGLPNMPHHRELVRHSIEDGEELLFHLPGWAGGNDTPAAVD